ncbi:putative nad-p-binding protein [Phaeoacremonium minimum UCRPA7]|uniref:Putative nad-p-binding protein n=1 Tax=Phaeoacremonium minimum (strain UCR-PA7) TaxID=1286976 RepID=R8BT63_PHAM7|nr:putative nad-p-binding protein [Phaeoacremonium minimum UCRPA7]EOO02489.1 putative nad-p-binding protein [Phaeoacremonium minimum UCRPA7]
MTTSLSGKVALVTGSSRSIGAGIAKRFAEDGANVVVNYVSNSQAAGRLVDSINARRAGAAIAIKGDVSTVVGGQRLLYETVKSYGKIDIIVLNAAIMGSKPLAEIDEQFFDDHMNANVKGQLFLVKAAAPHLTSVLPDALVYIATKGAIEQLSRALAKDFGVRGITVNTVSPGPTDTELFRKGKTESFINYIASQTPSNKLGQPEDIASVISFLASPAAGWINGQNIVANGGFVV